MFVVTMFGARLLTIPTKSFIITISYNNTWLHRWLNYSFG